MSSRIAALLAASSLALSCLTFLPASLAIGEETPSDGYKRALKTLLEVTGAQVAGEQVAYAVAQETLGAMAASGTQITEQLQQIVVDEALGEFGPSIGNLEFLTNLYAPIYFQHLNEKELGELLAFYQSPIGQKTLVAIPAISQTGALALQQKAFEKLPNFQTKVDAKLKAAGIVVAP